jgi:hypothetical protein
LPKEANGLRVDSDGSGVEAQIIVLQFYRMSQKEQIIVTLSFIILEKFLFCWPRKN